MSSPAPRMTCCPTSCATSAASGSSANRLRSRTCARRPRAPGAVFGLVGNRLGAVAQAACARRGQHAAAFFDGPWPGIVEQPRGDRIAQDPRLRVDDLMGGPEPCNSGPTVGQRRLRVTVRRAQDGALGGHHARAATSCFRATSDAPLEHTTPPTCGVCTSARQHRSRYKERSGRPMVPVGRSVRELRPCSKSDQRELSAVCRAVSSRGTRSDIRRSSGRRGPVGCSGRSIKYRT